MALSDFFRWFGADAAGRGSENSFHTYPPQEFHRILSRERARAERCNYCFTLIVFKVENASWSRRNFQLLFRELSSRMRVTDEAGWFDQNSIGVILHNASSGDAGKLVKDVKAKLAEVYVVLSCGVYSYPVSDSSQADDYPGFQAGNKDVPTNNVFSKNESTIPRLLLLTAQRTPSLKRCIDIAGSLFGLLFLAPLFTLLWLLIKIVSPGPALFKQVRIGCGGKPFVFWKFRTMRLNADATAHSRYLAKLIAGDGSSENKEQPMEKMDDDNEQIIPLGRVFRKTCLDELPQLVNVLRGEMSLIGPRPPIPYEVEQYKLWHTARLDVVPGMTGLWQVSGKNKLSFDKMVRLDIQYCRQKSFWLDMRILFKTPFAIAMEVSDSLGKLYLFPSQEKEA